MAAAQTARWLRPQLPSSADAVTIWCVSYLLVGSCELVQTFDICDLEFHRTRLSHEDRNDRGWLRRSRSGHRRHQARARGDGFRKHRLCDLREYPLGSMIQRDSQCSFQISRAGAKIAGPIVRCSTKKGHRSRQPISLSPLSAEIIHRGFASRFSSAG